MSNRKQPMNLAFGGGVSSLGSPQSTIAHDIDGRSYDFGNSSSADSNSNRASDRLRQLIAKAFLLTQSKNEVALSRMASNRQSANLGQLFLRWAGERAASELSVDSLIDYRTFVFSDHAASTAYGRYSAVARFASALMQNGIIERFAIPQNASIAAVDTSKGNAGSTFATALAGATHANGIDDFNEAALAAWVNTAWCELDTLFEKLVVGRSWRDASERPDIRGVVRSPKEAVARMSRFEVLELCKALCVHRLAGKVPHELPADRPPQSNHKPSWERTLRSIVWEASFSHFHPIQSPEISAAVASLQVPLVALPDWADSESLIFTETKGDATKRLVQLIHRRYGGYPFEHRLGQGLPALEDEESRLIAKLRDRAMNKGDNVSVSELVGYFHPSPPMVGLVVSLLCAAHVNPQSCAKLAVDCLDHDERPGMMRLKWRKERARGEQPAMPLPLGREGARTIPRLIQRFIDASRELRDAVPASMRDGLFIWAAADEIKAMTTNNSLASVWLATRQHLSGELGVKPSPEAMAALTPLSKHLTGITLSLIRRTAIDISSARLNRDFRATASLDGRRSIQALETSYLSNLQTRDHLDRQVRQGQAAMATWLTAKPIVLPDDVSKVSERLSVDMKMAQEIAQDFWNVGTGASLMGDDVVFIDTPLNALRAMQWIEHLRTSQARMERDSPGRWASMFQPQLSLFSEALHFFSRRNKAAATTMAKTHQLPFPDIH